MSDTLTHKQMEHACGRKIEAKMEMIGLEGAIYKREGKEWIRLAGNPGSVIQRAVTDYRLVHAVKELVLSIDSGDTGLMGIAADEARDLIREFDLEEA